MLQASPLRPGTIERESRLRLESTIWSDDWDLTSADVVPYFAFVNWGQRPSTWLAGQWRHEGNTHIAETPVTNIGSLTLAPGVHLAYAKVVNGYQSHVLALGKVKVN